MRHPSSLIRDQRGVTVVEFAIVAPVMLLAIMGLSDLTYRVYTQSILEGAVQKAGRDATIQDGANQINTFDSRVIGMMGKVAPGATYSSTRTSYVQFSHVNGERFRDGSVNGVVNGTRETGECYDDVNNSGTHNTTLGSAGQGGANDVVVFKMNVSYTRLFPLAGMLGWPTTQQISAQTFLKNQPFAAQNVPVVPVICT